MYQSACVMYAPWPPFPGGNLLLIAAILGSYSLVRRYSRTQDKNKQPASVLESGGWIGKSG